MSLPLRLVLPAAIALLSVPAVAGPAEGQVAWEAGDYSKAVAEWRPAAIAGDAAAQYGLGQAYLYGRGVATDLDQAELWFRKAAAQGHLEAQDNLGLLLFQQDKRRDALPYLERSAARGEPRAQYVLGTAKFNGDVVDKDWVGGYALMTRASAAGLPQASRALAQMDREIPLTQRQQGLVLARSMEVSGMKVAVAEPFPTGSGSVQAAGSPVLPPLITSPSTPPPTVPTPPARRVTPAPVARVDVPPSVPAPVFTPAPEAPSRTTVSAVSSASPPPTAASKPTTRSGSWLVQVGAFRSRSSAEARFAAVRSSAPSFADLQPFLQEAGSVTRVRAGPFTSRAEADKACRAIRATGQACFAVRR